MDKPIVECVAPVFRANSRSQPAQEPADDAERIERLVREHFAFVWRVARRWGLDPTEAEDTAQRVMLIASKRLDDLIPGGERAFLFRCAVRLATKHRSCRARCREVPFEEPDGHLDPGPNPEQVVEQWRARQQLDRILEEMPEQLRAAFVLFEIEDLSQGEIALTLGIPQGTVSSRLRRARELFAHLAVRHRITGHTERGR